MVDARQPTTDLNSLTPIVDENGTPSDYFMQQWRTIQESFVTFDEGITELTTLENDIAALKAIQIIAGTGLSGGGTLTSDVTLNLEDTAVTPGTFGDANNSAQITIDQQGRITAAADVPIAGGGGGGGPGSWTVIERQVITSPVATVDTAAFDPTLFDELEWIILNVKAVTDGVAGLMRFSTDSGVSFDATGNYDWGGEIWAPTVHVNVGAANSTFINLSGFSSAGNQAAENASFKINTNNFGDSSINKTCFWTMQESQKSLGTLQGSYGAAVFTKTLLVNAIRFFWSSGNVASGVFILRGRVKV